MLGKYNNISAALHYYTVYDCIALLTTTRTKPLMYQQFNRSLVWSPLCNLADNKFCLNLVRGYKKKIFLAFRLVAFAKLCNGAHAQTPPHTGWCITRAFFISFASRPFLTNHLYNYYCRRRLHVYDNKHQFNSIIIHPNLQTGPATASSVYCGSISHRMRPLVVRYKNVYYYFIYYTSPQHFTI